MDNTFLISFITAVFSFGSAIFYCLSCVENAVLSLVFKKAQNEEDIRFVHQALKRLSPLLPPSNGFVVLFGTGSLIYQCTLHNWNWQSLVILLFYILMNLYIIFIGKIAIAVKNLQQTDSNADIKKVTSNVRHLIIEHHLGLFANLGVVILEFIIFA